MVQRTFKEIPEGKIAEADQSSAMLSFEWDRGQSWEDLYACQRVLIISEAGTGKTYECQEQAKRLNEAGETALFLELATLAQHPIEDQLSPEQEEQFERWRESQNAVATLFLDSIDELQLTKGKLKVALTKLSKAIGSQQHRVRIVMTSRPTEFDRQIVEQLFPVPKQYQISEVDASGVNEREFVRVAMNQDHPNQKHDRTNQETDKNQSQTNWRTFRLLPLSDAEIEVLSAVNGVTNPRELLADLLRRNAEEFARRPQDLIELCADWKANAKIRTHADQVRQNIRVKLQPRTDREELCELSPERAEEGAKQLALALQLTRRLTLRHSAKADLDNSGSDALDPQQVLSDWSADEVKTLLERALFGFASYGRVRFHHRSVLEFLAADELWALLEKGMPRRALKRLLFADTSTEFTLLPSMRPVSGWLALKDAETFALLRDHEPMVLFDHGDPASLTASQRAQALASFCQRYGTGGWRGLSVPRIQVQRFASPDLAESVKSIWQAGIENPEVRELLLSIIHVGQIEACAELAFDVATDPNNSDFERGAALNALSAIADCQLGKISSAIAGQNSDWSNQLASDALTSLFPKHMTVAQALRTLSWITPRKRVSGDCLDYALPKLLTENELTSAQAEELRDGLVDLIRRGLQAPSHHKNLSSPRDYLAPCLAALCAEQDLTEEHDSAWLGAALLALSVHSDQGFAGRPIKNLQERVRTLEGADKRRAFWKLDEIRQSVLPAEDTWQRLYPLTCKGPLSFTFDGDFEWVLADLFDSSLDENARMMVLDFAVRLRPAETDFSAHIESLRSAVQDFPRAIEKLEDLLKPSDWQQKERKWQRKEEAREAKQKKKELKAEASWITFRQALVEDLETCLSQERGQNSCYNLSRVMANSVDSNRYYAWDSKFLKEQFGEAITERIRVAMAVFWREETPLMISEREPDKRNSYQTNWLFGLASAYADAEGSGWAAALSHAEAEQAIRYAFLELNGLPMWFGELVTAHPQVAKAIIQKKIDWGFAEGFRDHDATRMVRRLKGCSDEVQAHFTEHLHDKLSEFLVDLPEDELNAATFDGLGDLAQIIRVAGAPDERIQLRESVRQRLLKPISSAEATLWVETLIGLDPEVGFSAITLFSNGVVPSERSLVVKMLAALFGPIRGRVSLNDAGFSVDQLLRLTQLAHEHVRRSDDLVREGHFTPEVRDDAQSARGAIFEAFMRCEGKDALKAKLELAKDPLFEQLEDRIVVLAEEARAQEFDRKPLSVGQASAIQRAYEAPPATSEQMFALVLDRLADLNDLLVSDETPRDTWHLIERETLMRREIARELRNRSNGIYSVNQEAVTGDEKETDIRLCASGTDIEAVIELKIADNWTAAELVKAIHDQLVTKYLQPEHRRAGVFLISRRSKKHWKQPDGQSWLDFSSLCQMLGAECQRLNELLTGEAQIAFHSIDLAGVTE